MFIESPRFPDSVAYGATGGPHYSTSVVKSLSGRERFNQNWVMPLFEYNITHVKDFAAFEHILSFFHVAGGKFGAFRFRDFLDFKSCSISQSPSFNDQVIATANGTDTVFQLTKTYTAGSHSRVRNIYKPVDGSVHIGISGSEITTGFSIDYATGILTFSTPPALGSTITWGGEFDVPVRFESDDFIASVESFKLSSINIKLIEVRL